MNFRFSVTPRFERSLKKLTKRFPHLKTDLKKAFAEIETEPTTGNVIPDDFNIRKLRVSSTDMQRGKSGGFRLLYKLVTSEDTLTATLLFIYAKSDQEDVSSSLLKTLSDEMDDE